MTRPFALAALLVLLPSFAGADTTLEYDDKGQTSLLRIAAGKVRFDNPREHNWFLFDAARREMTLVEPAKGEFTVLDEATLDSVGRTLDAVAGQVEAQLAALPPAARAQMRQLLGGTVPDPAAPKTVRVEATGVRIQVGERSCEYHRVVVNGKAESEVCLASAAALGLPQADLATVRAWQDFARSVADKAGRYVSADAQVFGDGGQLPLAYRVPGAGGQALLAAISHGPVDAGALRVPAGYRQRKLELPGL